MRSKEGWGHLSESAPRQRLRRSLLVGQVAVATLLVVITGLTLRTLLAYRAIDLGFHPDHVLTFRLEAPKYKYADPRQAAAFLGRALDGVSRAPGIQVAGAGSRIPTEGSRNNPTRSFSIAGRSAPTDRELPWVVDLIVTPGYFEALGVPLLAGRLLERRDTTAVAPVAVVSRAQIKLGSVDSPHPWITIVGARADLPGANRRRSRRPRPTRSLRRLGPGQGTARPRTPYHGAGASRGFVWGGLGRRAPGCGPGARSVARRHRHQSLGSAHLCRGRRISFRRGRRGRLDARSPRGIRRPPHRSAS